MDPASEATRLSEQAADEASRQHFDQAIALLRRAVRLCHEADDHPGLQRTYLRLTNACWLGRHYDQALAAYREWLSIGQPNDADRAMILVQIGLLHLHAGDYLLARQQNESALEIYRRIGDTTVEAACLNNLITIFADRGEYERARAAHAASLRLSLGTRNARGAWESYWRVTAVHTDTGEFEEAATASDEAMHWAKTTEQSFAMAVAALAADEVALESGHGLDRERLARSNALAHVSRRTELRVWAAANAVRALARAADRSEVLATLDEERPAASDRACPYRWRVKFLLGASEALTAIGSDQRGMDEAMQVCDLARPKGALPMLARGLHLAGNLDEARDLARALGMKPLLARLA